MGNHGRLRKPNFTAFGGVIDIGELGNEGRFGNERWVLGGSLFKTGGKIDFTGFEIERPRRGQAVRVGQPRLGL